MWPLKILSSFFYYVAILKTSFVLLKLYKNSNFGVDFSGITFMYHLHF